MEQMVTFFPAKKVGFLICSDEDFRPLKSFFSGFQVYFGTGHIIEDLYGLADCDYLIGPPSTYSNWAAFYGQVPLFQIEGNLSDFSIEKFRIVTSYFDHRIDYPKD